MNFGFDGGKKMTHLYQLDIPQHTQTPLSATGCTNHNFIEVFI